MCIRDSMLPLGGAAPTDHNKRNSRRRHRHRYTSAPVPNPLSRATLPAPMPPRTTTITITTITTTIITILATPAPSSEPYQEPSLEQRPVPFLKEFQERSQTQFLEQR